MIFQQLSLLVLAVCSIGLASTDESYLREGKTTEEEFPTKTATNDAALDDEEEDVGSFEGGNNAIRLLGGLHGDVLKVPDTDPDPDSLHMMHKLQGNNNTKSRGGGSGGNSRIIGGTFANPQRYPYYCWMAIYNTFDTYVGSCGCSLIHTDMILSAAHCYVDNRESIGRLEVFVNATYNLRWYAQSGYEKVAYVKSVWWPDAYDNTPGQIGPDFMVGKLDRAITGISPVKLNPSVSLPSTGDAVDVFGFGLTSTDGSAPILLQEVEVTVKSSSYCNSKYPGGVYKHQHMLCAGDYGQGSCNGDSGGPLIVAGSSAFSDLQVGLVSFGSSTGCADKAPNSPTVYSRISWWYNEIVSIICSDSDYVSSMCSGDSGGGSCTTDPAGWVDNYGDGCDWYATNGCGDAGLYANQGISANNACCTCGGGQSPIPLSWNGWTGCSKLDPCGKCEGDCDSDSQCAGNLKCRFRDGLTSVPGCTGNGISAGDYCS